jgi:N,N'-diacetyl-8-epilegionaminate cytidylyltransferase
VKTIAFIFARGGSSMTGKNLRRLQNRDLLARAVDTAKAVRGIDGVVVSTDDEAIAKAALSAGADVPFIRPAALATDTAPEWLAWQHAITWARSHYGQDSLRRFVSIPTTAPLRTAGDVEACLAAYDEGGCDMVITVRPAERNPYFNMVRLDASGLARLVIEPERSLFGRQAALAVYDMTTVAYVAAPDFVLKAAGIFDGRVKAIVVPKERAIDIDDEWDLLAAEAYLRHTSECS